MPEVKRIGFITHYMKGNTHHRKLEVSQQVHVRKKPVKELNFVCDMENGLKKQEFPLAWMPLDNKSIL